MEAPLLLFRESLLSPWAQRPQSTPRARREDVSPRFLVQTVGSLDAVNAQVADGGLRRRAPLPELVMDTAADRIIEPVMPPKRRVVAGGVSHAQAKHRPTNGGGGAKTAETLKQPAGATAPQDREKEATLIELATFPGYTPSCPTPLPQGLDTLEQMRRVTRAQAKLAAKREGYREYWRENFYSPASQTVFLDTFWWFFLERYQPNRGVQSLLFSRVGENYVKFLMKTEIHTWKEKFMKAYPDAISQCVYTAFIHAFPASWSNFDANFKSALVEVVFLWQTGTRPLPETWRRWNFGSLDPPNSLKTIGQEEQQLNSKSLKQNKSFNLDTLVEEARDAEEGTPVISEATYLLSRDSMRSKGSSSASHTPPPEYQQSISRTELEGALTSKLFQHRRVTQDDAHVTSPRGRAESSKLEIARSQYLSLRKERCAKAAQRGAESGRTAPAPKPDSTCQKTDLSRQANPAVRVPPSHLDKSPKLTNVPVTRAKVPPNQANVLTAKATLAPPLPHKAPMRTKNSHNGNESLRKPKEAASTQMKAQPGAVHANRTQPVTGRSQAGSSVYPARTEKPPGTLKPATKAEETRGGKGLLDIGGKKCKTGTMKTVHVTKTSIPRPRGRIQGQGQPRGGIQGQGQPHGGIQGQSRQPRTEKPAGSLKPTSAAERCGLHNYAPEEGGKEKTWKEKALHVREKTGQRPFSILHKLHHQGMPMAGPDMDSMCFDLYGRSPLVKHYLQQRQLNKVTGYAILTKRTEVNQPVPSGAPTYDDIIKESLKESKEHSELQAAQRKEMKKQNMRILQDRLKMREKYKRQLRDLLSAQKEVESLSNELVAYWEQSGVDKTQGVASLKHTLSPDMQHSIADCINEAFQRCSTKPPP